MDIDNSVKISSIYIIAAIITSYTTALISLGMFPGIGRDDIIAGLIGIFILYTIGKLCEKLFGKQNGFKKLLNDGILPFIFVWFVTWTIIVNYAPILF